MGLLTKITNTLKSFHERTKEHGPEVATGLTLREMRKGIKEMIKPPIRRDDADKNLTDFINPWEELDFETRINKLNSSDKTKIVYLYPKSDYGTFRYRIYNMMQVIQQSNEPYEPLFFFELEIPELLKHWKKIDLLILVRQNWTPELFTLIDNLKKNNIKIVFDVDDIVYDIDYVPLLLEQISIHKGGEDYWFAEAAKKQLIAQRVDYFITTNEFLGNKIHEVFKQEVFIIKNFLNNEQYEISKELIKNDKENDKFTIGYFSGTLTHKKDFELVESAVLKMMEKYQDVEFMLVGHIEVPQTFLKFKNRLKYAGLHNFIDLQKLIHKCDLNLIPLVVNDFTNCKSELKFTEASIVKVSSIASPTFVYKQIIKDGENGFLAEPHEWFDKMKKLYLDKKLKQRITDNAYKYAKNNYHGDLINKNVISVLKKILEK